MKQIRVSAAVLAAACLLAASGANAFPGGDSGGSMGRGGPGGGHRPPSFDELDADGDGVVSETEFFAPMLEHGEERFVRMDENGDGSLTSDELVSGRPQRRGQQAGGQR